MIVDIRPLWKRRGRATPTNLADTSWELDWFSVVIGGVGIAVASWVLWALWTLTPVLRSAVDH
jgi:hypothetical protein